MSYSTIGSIFSPENEYFAYASLDGCLKIYETASNILKQEYLPSSHLSSTCTALAWGPCAQSKHGGRKRAKKNNLLPAIEDLKLIAMGTLSGDILLYSVSNGALHKKLAGSHTEGVSDVAWFSEKDSLFSCSSDNYIVQWSISEGSIKTKWKCGKSSPRALCVIDKNNLLSGGNSILWWNLKTQSIIKKFIGHGSDIFCLAPILMDEKKYFISSAVADRVVNVWHLAEDLDCSAIASFTLPDEPMSLDILESSSQCVMLAVVSRNNILNVFEHELNKKLKKPLSPKLTIQIASMGSQTEKPLTIPILSTKITDDLDTLILVYGNFLQPVFERIQSSSYKGETFLIRDSAPVSTSKSGGVTKVRQPERPNNVQVLAPGYMTPAKPTESVAKRKKRKSDTEQELPMEERLIAMNLGQAPDSYEIAKPSSESLVHLLLQGLQSQDRKLLDTVLQNSNEAVICSTVKKLPLETIPQCLVVLHEGLTRKESKNRPCLRWLKNILAVHISYLMTLEEMNDFLGPITQIIEAREETLSKFIYLKGFLDILWSQIDIQSETNAQLSSEALEIYEVESSSDEMEEEPEQDEDMLLLDLASNESHSEDDDDDDDDDDNNELIES